MAESGDKATGDLDKLLEPEGYCWLDAFLRASVPEALLAELEHLYENSSTECAGVPGARLILQLQKAVKVVPRPFEKTRMDMDALTKNMGGNVQTAWGTISTGGYLVNARRRMEPTLLHYQALGLDPIDLTDLGKVKRDTALASAARESAAASRASAENALQSAASAARWRWITTAISVLALLVSAANYWHARSRDAESAQHQPKHHTKHAKH